MGRNPLARDVIIYLVTVDAHTVHGSQDYEVPASEVKVGAVSENMAKVQALRWAQADAGVPPWLPYRRQGWKHVKATQQILEVIG
jgi:hypothetical protein